MPNQNGTVGEIATASGRRRGRFKGCEIVGRDDAKAGASDGAVSESAGVVALDIAADLLDVLRELGERQIRIEDMVADLHCQSTSEATRKEWYSTAEAAQVLQKRPFTVREWCRLSRIIARKRPTGRGDAVEWEISHEEIDRIRNHGLLPRCTKY